MCVGVFQYADAIVCSSQQRACRHNITILRSGSQSLCKRFSLGEGVVNSQRASMPAYFTCESQAVDGIDALARLLTDLERDRSRFIIRGQLAEDVDKDKPVRRRLRRLDRKELLWGTR